MSKIFLRKTGYVIKDNLRVEQDENIEEPVMSFYQAIKKFKSGQVYEVLLKQENGKYQSYNKLQSIHQTDSKLEEERESKRFLINIIIQEVILNDQTENIVFFKDVTFGVLYEQIKVSEKLSNFINDTLS